MNPQRNRGGGRLEAGAKAGARPPMGSAHDSGREEGGDPPLSHPWDLTPREALALQQQLAERVVARGAAPAAPMLVAGCDATGSGRWSRGDERITAAVVLLRYPGWECVEAVWAAGRARMPYIPGLLSFREVPVYLEAFARLRARPALLLCDGQGIAHPRGFGLASHLGVLLDLPTVGVAKSRLIGTHREPGLSRGSSTRLLHEGRLIGRVLRTQTGVRPLYISPGHRIGIEESARIVLRMAAGYRLPEPTRLADRWVGTLRGGGGRDSASR
ncbi:MAG: deoxyribonuclease V [Candidatus Eisenbacteria bacterium]